jgi:hypothetical protein
MYTLGKTLTLHGKSNNLYSNLAYIYLRQGKKKGLHYKNHLVAYSISRFCNESYYDGFIEVMVAN